MTENVTGTPMPEITDLTRPFWTGAKANRLMMQKCPRCGTVNFPPKPWCIKCGNRAIEWIEVGPRGTVYSFTVSRTVAMNYPGWQAQLPVVLGLIDVDEGARMYGQVVDCAPEDIAIGMWVEAVFIDLDDEHAIPKFRPVAVG